MTRHYLLVLPLWLALILSCSIMQKNIQSPSKVVIWILVYKFLHSGKPKYFEPFLIPRHSANNTRGSQSDGMFLEVPHFASVFKSRKHFGLSFVYDAPMIWNDLPDEVHSANSLASFRSKLKSYLFGKAYPP